LYGEVIPTNPKFLVESWAFEMVRLWRFFQGGMGAGLLPDEGGTIDQAMIMLAAFSVMSAAEAELKPEKS